MTRIVVEAPEGDRPTRVREKPCKHCPIVRDPEHDPETEQCKELVEAGEMSPDDATYTCAWDKRRVRCRGAADYYGYIPA